MAIPQVVYLPIDDLHKGGVTYSPIKVERFAQQGKQTGKRKGYNKEWEIIRIQEPVLVHRSQS